MRVNLADMQIPTQIGDVTFRNPFYVASGPTSKSIEHLVKADQMGWAGASIKLTFDPAPYVSLDPRYGWWKDQDLLSFSAESRLGVEAGLQLVAQGRKECRPDFRIMANITYVGDKPGVQGWVDMAKKFEDIGAHIIELNMCCPNMSYNVHLSGKQDTAHQTGASLGQNAEALGAIVAAVRKGISLPLFVKITPEGGRIAQVAKACFDAGADTVCGVANRLGIPLVDLDDPLKSPYQLQKEPSMSCLSGPWIRPLALRDIYEIRKFVGPDPRLSYAGGLMDLRDTITAVACGADLLAVCTGILLKGFEMLPPLVAELKTYLKDKGYAGLADIRDGLVREITPATKLTITKGVARKKNAALRGPCETACPFNVPAQDYVRLIADGDFESAYQVIAGHSPLQSVCGWVCNHPCETECTRALIDEPLRIRDLKRFVLERAAKENWIPDIVRAPQHNHKAAVIGAGPAGLSAAFHLARAGYKVTIFEAREKAGGMLRYAIPRFRLPENILEAELTTLRNLGVKLQTGKRFGEHITHESLKAKGYQTCILAIGASAGLPLGIPGENTQGCITALDYLDKTACGQTTNPGKRVAIIGGGFTAVDSARTAIRQGAEEVYLLYRRTRNEMPATSEEVDEAETEGVKIMYLVSPKEIIAENGQVAAIRMVNHVLAEPDTSGQRRPEEVEGTEFTLAIDTVISAVSQKIAQNEAQLGIKLDGNKIATAADNVSTDIEYIFAAGDAATGPDSIIAAIAGGYNAALAADRAITKDSAFLHPLPQLTPADKELILARNPNTVKRNRIQPNLRTAEERIRDFDTYQTVMTEAEAIAEASRCLNCGCTAACGLCQRICSSFAVSLDPHTRQEQIDTEKCHACGMCVQLCPNKNIELVAETETQL